MPRHVRPCEPVGVTDDDSGRGAGVFRSSASQPFRHQLRRPARSARCRVRVVPRQYSRGARADKGPTAVASDGRGHDMHPKTSKVRSQAQHGTDAVVDGVNQGPRQLAHSVAQPRAIGHAGRLVRHVRIMRTYTAMSKSRHSLVVACPGHERRVREPSRRCARRHRSHHETRTPTPDRPVSRQWLYSSAANRDRRARGIRLAPRGHPRRAVVIAPDRGQVWWGEIEQVGRRPFLIMTRSAAIPVLNSVLAAPGTRKIRGIPLNYGSDRTMACPPTASSASTISESSRRHTSSIRSVLSGSPVSTKHAQHFEPPSTAGRNRFPFGRRALTLVSEGRSSCVPSKRSQRRSCERWSG